MLFLTFDICENKKLIENDAGEARDRPERCAPKMMHAAPGIIEIRPLFLQHATMGRDAVTYPFQKFAKAKRSKMVRVTMQDTTQATNSRQRQDGREGGKQTDGQNTNTKKVKTDRTREQMESNENRTLMAVLLKQMAQKRKLFRTCAQKRKRFRTLERHIYIYIYPAG